MADNKVKKPEVTFKLGRIENLDEVERNKVEGLPEGVTQGLVIKEYKSGSFVKLRRFVPTDNLFTAQVAKELSANDRKIISEGIKSRLGL